MDLLLLFTFQRVLDKVRERLFSISLEGAGAQDSHLKRSRKIAILVLPHCLGRPSSGRILSHGLIRLSRLILKRMLSLNTVLTNSLPYLFSSEILWVAKVTLGGATGGI